MRLAEREQQYTTALATASQTFSVDLMSDVGTLAMQTDAQLASLTSDTMTPSAFERQRRKMLADKAALAEEKARLECELAEKQQQLDHVMSVNSQKLQQKQDLISEKEHSMKLQNQSVMQSVAMQTDYIERLEHKQVTHRLVFYGLKATLKSVCCDTNRLNIIFEEPQCCDTNCLNRIFKSREALKKFSFRRLYHCIQIESELSNYIIIFFDQ